MGMSLIEALVTITIVGVLSAIAIPIYGGVREKAVGQVGVENLDWLNQAVMHHNNLVGIVSDSAVADSASDEQGVVDLLTEVRPPDPLVPGGYPFLRPTPTLLESDNESVPRYSWDGSYFVMIPAGEEGTGVVIR